ncbi:MAG: enoyl-CoA hydratase-related protein, partial [bacterium]
MRLERRGNIGVLYIDTDNNNAINFDFITESHRWMDEIEQDPGLDALVVTASHKTLFSPGVDLVTVMGYSREELRRFYEEITALIRRKFLFSKPEVYALNGHT